MQQVIDFGTSEPTLAPILTGDKWDTVWQTLANDEDLNYVDASTGTSMANLITTGTNAIYKALTDGWTMSLAYSSGKDSECVLHLFLMALVRANGINRRTVIHVLLLEDIRDGRLVRNEGDFLCTAAGGSNGKLWVNPATHSDGEYGPYVCEITCKQCIKAALRWQDKNKAVPPECVP